MKIREKDLYLENGYLNIDYILGLGFTFTAIVGGRGTGKTFGILKYLVENHKKFLHVRRTKTQRELIDMDANNNFLKLNEMMGWNIHPIKGRNCAEYHQCAPFDDKSNALQRHDIIYDMAKNIWDEKLADCATDLDGKPHPHTPKKRANVFNNVLHLVCKLLFYCLSGA